MNQIGIIVSIYNTERYLNKCIDSILGQSWSHIRLVLIDDGCTDGCGEICDKYVDGDRRVSVVHQKNSGVLAAAIKGIELLKGCKYVSFVDSDDWIADNTYLELSQYIDCDYDVISFDMIRYYSPDKCVYTSEDYKKGEYDRLKIEKCIYPTMLWDIKNQRYGLDPSLCNKLIKYTLLKKYLYNAAHIRADYGQDVAVIYPMMRDVNSLFLAPGYFYYHRQREFGEIPRYISDPDFVEKIHRLYKYLLDCYYDNLIVRRQIDFFFVQAHELRLFYLYRRRTIRGLFVFPFDKVNKQERIILYGAGDVGRSYVDQIIATGYCDIVSWIDQNPCISYRGYETCSVIEALDAQYDHIVISTCVDEFRKQIEAKLVGYGVEKNKII